MIESDPWRLVIDLALLGTPVAMYFAMARSPKDDIRRPRRFFHWSFWIATIAMVLIFAIVVGVESEAPAEQTVFGVLLYGWMIAGLTYLIALGVLASRLGLSWIGWVGSALLTAPIGLIVTYVLMHKRTKPAANQSG